IPDLDGGYERAAFEAERMPEQHDHSAIRQDMDVHRIAAARERCARFPYELVGIEQLDALGLVDLRRPRRVRAFRSARDHDAAVGQPRRAVKQPWNLEPDRAAALAL